MFVGIKSSEWRADGNYKEMVGVLQFYANTHLVGGFNPSEKYDLVKLDVFGVCKLLVVQAGMAPTNNSRFHPMWMAVIMAKISILTMRLSPCINCCMISLIETGESQQEAQIFNNYNFH